MLRTALITIYKAFVRPGLDSGDILYDQAFNLSFHQKLESTQYSANLAITRAIHSISRKQDLLRAKLRISSITTVVRKLAMFYKIYKNSPLYLLKIIPEKTSDENMLRKNFDGIPHINIKLYLLKNTFFLSPFIEWNELDPNIRNSERFSIFKSNILKFIRSTLQSFRN